MSTLDELTYYFRNAFNEYRVDPWECASIISAGLTVHVSRSINGAGKYGNPNRFLFWLPPIVQIKKAMTSPNIDSEMFASALAFAIETSIFTIYTQSQIAIVGYQIGPLQVKFQAAFRNILNVHPGILAASLAAACYIEFKQIYITYWTPTPAGPGIETTPIQYLPVDVLSSLTI